MSSGGGSMTRFDRIRDHSHFSNAFGAPLRLESPPQCVEEKQESERTAESSLFPSPPPPVHFPVGPEFYPSDSEDNLVNDAKPSRHVIPAPVKDFFQGGKRSSEQRSIPDSEKKNPSVVNGSGPGSFQEQHREAGHSSYSEDHKPDAMVFMGTVHTVDGRSVHTALTYEERVAQYRQTTGYMKSWAGLLRILGCVELLFGAAVFACVCAYIYKDNEWYNMFGYAQSYSGYTDPGMYGGGGFGSYGGMGGYGGSGMGGGYYTGPQTPFVLVVAGLAWVVTVCLLVLGMTMYYRTVLLDSGWWPLTECAVNLVLAVLYLAGAIVYVRDTVRGGLCYYPYFNNGLTGGFCRTEPGQTAAIVFLFVVTLVYLAGTIVCIKLQRHEAARIRRDNYNREMAAYSDSAPRPMVFEDSVVPQPKQAETKRIQEFRSSEKTIPKPIFLPDYVEKYPSIQTDEERDRYKAVFKDQHAEYKELHTEVQAVLRRFDELDELMRTLPRHPSSHMEQERIHNILQEYQGKKTDPAFLEKKDRCEYLKNKLSHIKQKIQEYNNSKHGNDGYG